MIPARHAFDQREADHFLSVVAISTCAADACRVSKLPG